MQTNRLHAAFEHIQRAIDLGFTGADTHNNLGEALRAANRLPEAIAAYQSAIGKDPNHASAHANLGCSVMRMEV